MGGGGCVCLQEGVRAAFACMSATARARHGTFYPGTVRYGTVPDSGAGGQEGGEPFMETGEECTTHCYV